MHLTWVFLALLVPVFIVADKPPRVARINDISQLRALIRARPNVLVYYHVDGAVIGDFLMEVAEEIGTKGNIAFVYCDGIEGEEKKMCKTMKVNPKPFVLRHYQNGEFHMDFDRPITVKSLTRFMLDPDLDASWEEDPESIYVKHINSEKEFIKCINEKRPTFFLFYKLNKASKAIREIWAEIAKLNKLGNIIIAGIDIDIQENKPMCNLYQVNDGPVIHYFSESVHMFPYQGQMEMGPIVEWTVDPMRPEPPTKIVVKLHDPSWSEDPQTSLVHLDEDTLDSFLKKNKKALIIFHAPWCGACNHFRPVFENFARRSKAEGHQIGIGAVDGTKTSDRLRNKFGVDGYPSVKYFEDGNFRYDQKERQEQKLIEWIREPAAPAPPPPEWHLSSTDVVHLTDERWEKVGERKHALVMFYAPWCGHCKDVKPEYEIAATMLKHSSNYMMGAVDCTREERLCQREEIGAYPKFKYYQFGDFVEVYRSGRGRNNFVEFMAGKADDDHFKDEL